MIEVKEILKRNGFAELSDGIMSNDKCNIKIGEDHYEIEHYDEDFLEFVTWYSNDLLVTSLMGYLSWNDFIERGYNK